MGTGNLGNTAAAPDRGMEIVGGGFIELQSYNSRLLIMGCWKIWLHVQQFSVNVQWKT